MQPMVKIGKTSVVAVVASAVAWVLAPGGARGQGAFPPPGPNIVRRTPVDKSGWMTQEQIRRAKPQPVEGALWSATVPPSLRKVHLVGRPARVAITGGTVNTPFEDRILGRGLSDGRFGINGPAIGRPVDQVVWRQGGGFFGVSGIAVTFFPEADRLQEAGDILHMRAWSTNGSQWLKGHKSPPWRVVIGPEGKRLASCSDDASIRLWDLASGKEIARFPGYGYGGNMNVRRGEFAAFSPDGRLLVTAFGPDVSIRRASNGGESIRWQLDRQMPIAGLDYVRVIRFALDGTTLFAYPTLPEVEGKAVRFGQWDFYDSAARWFEGTQSAIDGKMSPDRKYLVTWNGSARIAAWDLHTRDEIKVWEVAPRRMYDLTYAPSRDILATAGDDGLVRFWNVGEWTERKAEREFHHPKIDFVRFSKEGKYLITGSDDGLIIVWEAPRFAWVKGLETRVYRPWLDEYP